jgi:hypothetical protein
MIRHLFALLSQSSAALGGAVHPGGPVPGRNRPTSSAKAALLALVAALSLLSSIGASFAQVPAPVPALPDSERRTAYSITSSTCTCNVNFALFGDTNDYQNWVEVWLNGVNIAFNDPTFGWTITSPSGPLSNLARPISDAVLTFNSAQTGAVQIVGARRPRRTSQFQENVGVPTRNFNVVLSDIIAMLREVWDKINDVTGRVIVGQPGEILPPLPQASARAGQFLCFNSSGQPTTCTAIGGSTTLQPGTGISLSGTNPTTISQNTTAGVGIAVAPSGSAEQVSLANMPADTAWCNPTGSTAAPQQCTGAQLAALGIGVVNTFTSNHPIAQTDCGTVVQMGAGSTGQLTVTLPSVLTGTCPIRIYNGDTYSPGNSRGKILSGFPANAFYILFPQQSIDIKVSNGAWVVDRAAGRWMQPGPQLFAAKSTGSPSDTANDCMSLAHPCLTINHTMGIVYANVDNMNGSPTVFLNGGDQFQECVQVQGQLTGTNVGFIEGASGTGTSGGPTWGNVTGPCAPNALLSIGDNAEWEIQGILMTNASGTSGIDGIHMHQTGVIDVLSGMAFGPFPGATAIGSDNNSMINMDASYTIIAGGGTTPTFFGIGPATTLNECGACTTTFISSPTITDMYSVSGAGSTINFGPSHTFSGTATISQACSVNGPSAISMAGNTLPGTTACTSATTAHNGVVF